MNSGNDTAKKKFQNRLALEKSPYLLQHAENPVEWYPWGDEAFEKARKEDKLIFLSVGYSTCHWCHVMERESFESPDIAQVMNKNFVNIKVDREERPDVDKMYMTFVQATTGSGGWPMSVWLSPDLTPVYGGTYYPPEDRYYGRPGFRSVLEALAKQWKEDRQKFTESGSKVVHILRQMGGVAGGTSIPGSDSWNKCCSQLSKSYEPRFGGFGGAPKFPQPSNLVFLLHLYAREPTTEAGKRALEMCSHTLRMMARGGMHDHISQGFARYSTDDRWHVPHFEKMLYDQAQLAIVYSEGYLATGDEFFADTVRDILTYVSRDLSHESGGFYSAEDADSYPEHGAKEKKEGAFCVWTQDDVNRLLNQPILAESESTDADDGEVASKVTLAQLFSHHYGVKPSGNVNPYQDPHDELKGKNVLTVEGSEQETSEAFGLTIERTLDALKRCRDILRTERLKRPRPHLDDKMVTAWNGLMISGYANAGQALQDPSFVERAIKAAHFIEKYLYQKESGKLLRSCYRGSDGGIAQIPVPIEGFSDDYAFVIQGFLDTAEASHDPAIISWLIGWAEKLQEKQDALFWDADGNGGYFTGPVDSVLLLRLKEDQDGAEPSANSVAVSNLLRLSSLLERSDWRERAGAILKAFQERLVKVPLVLPRMVSGLMLFHDSPTMVYVAGSNEDPEGAAALLKAAETKLVAGRVMAVADGPKDNPEGGLLQSRNDAVKRMKAVNGKAAAYVCRQHVCSLPVTSVKALAGLLEPPESKGAVAAAVGGISSLGESSKGPKV
ncbi:spermatogenesis-associated protein 20 [Ischnura elegans]|uniref:spermatogenesis-associated protein 20 n=1 Tax=Ischnura elegans TaxID=197161 RepID=UPI001ED86BD9|nr:spermatogenesis-associated protein 20 [Ischnura elegans]